jgi:flagellar assembly protein FliH
MQSSFNVIKNISVQSQGNKEITTEFNNITSKDENARLNIDSYENLAKNIIENARRQGDKILCTAYEEAEEILQRATSTGYKEGYDKGYLEGNEQGYTKIIGPASEEAKELIANAEFVLYSAKKQCENYIEEKEKEIKEFILIAVENILKQKVESSDALNNMVTQAIVNSKNVKLFIIRTNSLYFEALKSQVSEWKTQLGYKEDIIIIEDNLIEPGSAIIEKDNGKIVVGIDKGLEKLREILQGKE